MTSAAWTAASSAAGVVGVFVVLVRHMLATARQQGARDERERQMAGRIDKLENRVEGVTVIEKHIVALDMTVQGWDKRFESLESSVRDGFDRFDHLLRPASRASPLRGAASARWPSRDASANSGVRRYCPRLPRLGAV